MNRKIGLCLLPILVLSSCGGEAPSTTSSTTSSSSEGGQKELVVVEEREVQYLNDNYQNYYQIFPYSYADSNGDGIGDLRGIIDKFDYIKSLNVTGLWLTPVTKAYSYHKYDTIDYKDIDPIFGDLDDYDELVRLCHENHMKIIVDLVLNHSSTRHEWFKQCMNAHTNYDEDNQYYDYYVVEDYEGVSKQGYYRYGDFIYEARFWDQMPDLNLQGVIDGTNEYLIEDITDIMNFWLIDHDVDGFRLDACTSFFTDNYDKNYEFLNWVKEKTEEIKPGSYVIGEVLESGVIYSKYYKNTDVDSYFCFDAAGKYNNMVYAPVVHESAVEVNSFIARDLRLSHGGIPAPTIANHDIGRSCRTDLNNNKLQHAVLSLGVGSPFEYYGEEIGMKTVSTSPEDVGFRLPLLWGDKYTCRPISGTYAESDAYAWGSVKDQKDDPNSMLNYFSKCYRLRLENPEIARGTCELIYQTEDESCAVLKRSYNNSDVYVVMNFSTTLENAVDVSGYNAKVVGDLSVNETPYYQDGKLVMPPQSILILH